MKNFLTTIRRLKSGKAVGEDEIRPEMLKTLNGKGINWLTRVFQMAGKLGKTPNDWQTGFIIPMDRKGDRKECTNYWKISLRSHLGKVNDKCFERKRGEIVESKIKVKDGQRDFRSSRCTTDQIFTKRQIFEKYWEHAKDAFACFFDL